MGASSLQSLPGSVTFMEWGLATSPEMLAGEAASLHTGQPRLRVSLRAQITLPGKSRKKQVHLTVRTLCKGRTQEKWKTWSSKGPEVCRAWNAGLLVLHLVLVRMLPGQNSQRNA